MAALPAGGHHVAVRVLVVEDEDALADAIAIYELASKQHVPCFSSSSVRFTTGVQELLKNEKLGAIAGAVTWGDCSYQEGTPDMFFYGIHGIEPLFAGSARKYPVYFNYPWSEEDAVTIDLPAGFSLDNADAPQPFSAGPLSDYKPTMGITQDGKQLVYKRKFFFGGGGGIVFPVDTYPKLKLYFDAVHQADNHTITLKQSAATAATP